MITGFSASNGAKFHLDGEEYTVEHGGKPWSIGLIEPDTLRFEVRSGDLWPVDTPEKERSEIDGDRVYLKGARIVIEYDFMIEAGDPNTNTGGVDDGKWTICGDFHVDGPFSNSYCIELIRERMAVRLTRKSGGGDIAWYEYTDPVDIERGHWYHMRSKLRLLNKSTGYARVWRDGVQIVNYNGPLGYGYGHYWKQGIYRREVPETLAVNYRGLKVTL